MIKAQSRSKNVAGYAMDLSAYSTPKDATDVSKGSIVTLELKAFTPVMDPSMIFSVYGSLVGGDGSANYDTVMCTSQWFGEDPENDVALEVHDYSHTTDLYNDDTSGDYLE